MGPSRSARLGGMNPLGNHVGRWEGTCAFRLMPTDEFSSAPSFATSNAEADGYGWSLRYVWSHPDDGVQSATLLLGSPDQNGAVTAAWIDAWHQKPQLGVLTGSVIDGGVRVAMDYDGWGWTIEVFADGDELRMVMNNVIPEGVEGAQPGPYVVMDAHWKPVAAPSA